MSFESEISNFAEKAEKRAETIVKKAVIELCTDIISDTPVDTGRLKNNWFPSVGEASEETTEETKLESVERAANFVDNELKLGTTLYFTNNLPYAYRIEFDGWSSQAPQGMIRKNVSRWHTTFKKAAK